MVKSLTTFSLPNRSELRRSLPNRSELRRSVLLRIAVIIFSASSSAYGETLALSQKDVALLILRESNQAKEIDLAAKSTKLAWTQAQATFDYTFAAEAGHELSKFENFGSNISNKDETLKSQISLSKPFSTGTLLGLQYTRTSLRQDLIAGSSSSLPPSQQTQDIFGLSFEQNLLKNSFGAANRADLKAAEHSYTASSLVRANQLQDLVLTGLRAFWNAYVTQETFQEAVNSRARYQQLVQSIKKKSSYGYTGPGELAQAQAELEFREENVKVASTVYLRALDELANLLKYSAETDVKFIVSDETPFPPAGAKTEITQLRGVQSQKLKVEATRELETAAKSRKLADLSLVAKLYQTGLEETPDSAYSEMASATHPKYYLGLKFQYSFGSGIQAEDYENKKLNRQLEESKLERQLADLKSKENDLQRRINENYSQVISSKTQNSYREKAVHELTKSYNQGRTDIAVLIEALNKYFNSEIQHTRAVGDYQITLNEWAAFRDELIPSN